MEPTTGKHAAGLSAEHAPILDRLHDLYAELFKHNGYGELRLEMRFLKRGQKEIVISCGKDYRFVVSYPPVNRMHRTMGS